MSLLTMLGLKELDSYGYLDKLKELLACERCGPPVATEV
jgi:hypothetical protein